MDVRNCCVFCQGNKHKEYDQQRKFADELEALVDEIAREHGINIQELENTSFDKAGTPNSESLLKFSRVQNVIKTVRSAAVLIIKRTNETEHATSQKRIEESIERMKACGLSYEEALTRINDQKYAKSGTHHPTEGLRDVVPFLKVVESAEKATQKEREAALREVISSMLDNPIGAIKKNSVRDEIESDRIFAKIHNKGANIARERIRQAFEKVYGRRPGIGEVRPDLARRTWIHDSDGKNNAEGWAMLAATAYDISGAFDQYRHTKRLF